MSPVTSSPEWEKRGTDEPDIRDTGTVSPSGVYEPHVTGRSLSVPPDSGAVDPQPFNPSYQKQTGITDWINVRSIGAAGDGVVDDTGFFQAANLIAQQPPGRMIYIPAGTYKLTSNITFSAGVQWLNMGTVSGGTLSGGTPVSFGGAGLANPMTTTGDMITAAAAGVPQRLAPGSNGQVLSIAAGVPAWQNAPSGFANPMTTTGDLLIEGAGPAPRRLPAGAAGQILTMASGLPSWATFPLVLVTPSGDTSGATDAANLNAAFTALFNAGTGGTVYLPPGDFYINAQVTIPQQTGTGRSNYGPCSLIGSRGATVIHHVGGATGLYAHRTIQWGPVQNNQPNPMTVGGVLRDFTLDGTNAPIGAIGLDAGDAWGMVVDIAIENYYTAGAIGFYQANRSDWSEKCRWKLDIINCTNCVVVDTVVGNVSHEYNDWDLYLYCHGAGFTTLNQGQNGITWQNGAFQGGGRLFIRGNHSGNGTGSPGSLITVKGQDGSGNWSQLYNVEMNIVVESNAASNGPVFLTLGGANNSFGGHGQIVAQFGGWISSVLNGGTVKFSGRMHGDSVLAAVTTPSIPASGGTVTNNGNDATVFVSGGSNVNITINGVSTGRNGGSFPLRADGTISMSYTSAPTWVWAPAMN